MHAPEPRELLATIDGWELRQFASTERGAGHVQLWLPDQRVSIVTPSRATAGQFEARIGDERLAARTWKSLRRELAYRGVAPPGRHIVRALERWFVLPTESASGRLLRTWWAGIPEYAR